MKNKKHLFFLSIISTSFLMLGCSKQPQIICPKGSFYNKNFNICQMTNKPIKAIVLKKTCNDENCEYILKDERNVIFSVKRKKGLYKVGDIVNIYIYNKPKYKKDQK